jgi:small subunit ribosomal protein S21|tara:strand:- start:835 stop:1143 length:309 start_codon:yes stop_codon:yes gene_type:complete
MGLFDAKADSTKQNGLARWRLDLLNVDLSQKDDENHMQVSVRDNNVDQALRALKKKLQREGVFREMKLKEQFEKPSEKKAREKAEAIRRARKLARKKLEREA